MDSKSLSHTKWKCQYHIVFIPKYRKKKLYGQVKHDVREIISMYVATIGNITEDAIKKYIQEQSEESRKEDSDGAAL